MAIEKTFKIEGMDCADCAQKIEGAVSKIQGITSARILFSSSKLLVGSAATIDSAAIVKAVEQLGYKATPNEESLSISLFIEGMDCADEARVLEKKLHSLSGIVSFEIKFASKKIDVNYTPSRLSAHEIIKVIAETGMKARLVKTIMHTKPWWQDTRVKLVLGSGVFLAIAFVLEKTGFGQDRALFIYGASILVGSFYPLKMALAGLRARMLNIYTLLVVATIGAITLGFWDEAAMLVFVYTWGAILETYATEKARSSLKVLTELIPREALVKRDGQEIAVSVEDVGIDETIIIKPGEKIPLDGTVLTGSSTVDQSPITGESISVGKGPGDTVFAGSLNQHGSMDVKVNKTHQDTTLARIVHSVERSEAKKSSYQHFAERFGRLYTPIMFGVAIVVATIPWLLGEPFTPWFYRGLVVLVVSCSCGLVLSVPISVLAAVSAAARKGVLIKGGADLEAAGKVKAVIFDKTGTLTIGLPMITDVIPYNTDSTGLLSIAASIESRSKHPLADAILRKAREDGIEIKPVADIKTLVGLGVRGNDNERSYYVGNRRLCNQLSIPLGQAEKELSRLESEGKTIVLVMSQDKILGIIAATDTLRPQASDAIIGLKKNGIERIIMLTGDNESTAKAVASQAGVDEYRAQLLPDDKVVAIKEYREKYDKVAMVGDGVNDAPAMAAADVGIAMGAAGTDIAIEISDLALMSDDLSQLPYALKISRKAMTIIKQNVAISVATVTLVVTLALIGKISLVPGLLINEVGALVVMLNGLRLLRN